MLGFHYLVGNLYTLSLHFSWQNSIFNVATANRKSGISWGNFSPSPTGYVTFKMHQTGGGGGERDCPAFLPWIVQRIDKLIMAYPHALGFEITSCIMINDFSLISKTNVNDFNKRELFQTPKSTAVFGHKCNFVHDVLRPLSHHQFLTTIPTSCIRNKVRY